MVFFRRKSVIYQPLYWFWKFFWLQLTSLSRKSSPEKDFTKYFIIPPKLWTLHVYFFLFFLTCHLASFEAKYLKPKLLPEHSFLSLSITLIPFLEKNIFSLSIASFGDPNYLKQNIITLNSAGEALQPPPLP